MRNSLPALLLLGAFAASATAQDVLVVAPKEFEPSLADWRAHREAQGLAVAVREPGDDVGATVRAVHGRSAGKLRFLLVLGDVEKVPCATRVRRYDAAALFAPPDEEIATDAPWADVDGDGMPDLAVGRVPADTAAQAKALLARSIAYETSRDFGAWRSKLNVVAGTGGFGPMVDMALENLCRQLLAENVPPSVEVTMTYASPLSPFCPPPAEFADYAVKRWSEGALVVAYVGHGSERAVDRVHTPGKEYPILDVAHVARIEAAAGAPVSMFIACSTGHMDGAMDCLAEELLLRPKGPVAVIASSRISSPYSNGILAKEMLDALFKTEVRTTGELLLAAKERLVRPADGDARRAQLERMAAGMFEKDDEKRETDRRDHLNLYNLLGDPCVRIDRPAKLPLTESQLAVAGVPLRVSGTAPFDGELTVVVERGRKEIVKPVLRTKTTDDDYRTVYEAANSRVVARAAAAVKAGAFDVEVALPADTKPGACAVRVFLTGREGAAAGGFEFAVTAAEAAK